MKLIPFQLLFIVLLCCANAIFGQGSSIVDAGFAPVLDDFPTTAYTLARQSDGKTLVGGYFSTANGAPTTNIARFNLDGTRDVTFTSIIGVYGNGLRSIAVLPDGKIMIGGNFFHPQTFTNSRLLRLNADGSFDPSFTTTANGTVTDIKLQSDGKIILGGSFTTINGQSRLRLARLNANGTFDSTFIYNTQQIDSIAVQSDDKLVISEVTQNVDTTFTFKISRITSNGNVDNSFATITNTGSNYRARILKVDPDGRIIVGGNFFQLGTSFRTGCGRLNSDGSIDSTFNPVLVDGSLVEVRSVDFDEQGQILIAGSFSSANGTNTKNVARLNGDGSTDTTFAATSGPNNLVYGLKYDGNGKTIIVGDFTKLGSDLAFRVARLDSNGDRDVTYQTRLNSNGVIHDIEIQSDNKIVVGGRFFWNNGISSGGLTRFLPDGTLDPTFVDFSGSLVYFDSLENLEITPDGKILAVGSIFIGSSPTNYGVVRFNPNGSLDTSFTPVTFMSDTPKVVRVLPNGQILVGGNFSGLNTATRPGIARLNANGSVDSSYLPSLSSQNFSPSVTEIIVQSSGKVLIAGNFDQVGGINRKSFALLNSDGTLDVAFNPTFTGIIHVLEQLQNGNILVGGTFTSINSTPRNNLAILLPTGDLDVSFNTGTTMTPAISDADERPDGRITIGYNRTLKVLNANGSTYSDLPANRGFNSNIYDVETQIDGQTLVGGTFTQVDSQPRSGLARITGINFSRKVPFDFDGDGKTDLSIFRPNGAEWWWSNSSNGGNGAVQFGAPSDDLVPVDFTGDGKTDVAFWRPETGNWFVLRSEDLSFYAFPFGAAGDVPVPGDYDGDGKADAAVFRESSVTWYINRSSGGTDIVGFGAVGDKPVNADYDGDGKADIAIYRPNGPGGAEWWVRRSSNASVFALQFGSSTDKAVPGDFTGDGKADVAFWRPSTGFWNVLRSEDFSYYAFPFGANGDIASPGDYDGDGKLDAAVFRPSSATWFANRSTAGTLIQQFGAAGDVPVPSAFVR